MAEPLVRFENKEENEEKIVYLGDNKPVIMKSKSNQKQKIKETKATLQTNGKSYCRGLLFYIIEINILY